MKGYIGVTAREWFNYLSKNKNMGEVIFWRKNTNNFRVLRKAVFERFEALLLGKAWNGYNY